MGLVVGAGASGLAPVRADRGPVRTDSGPDRSPSHLLRRFPAAGLHPEHYRARMLLVALTGGIGSGKSTVAAGLAKRGAAVVDADGVSREILEPDGAAYQAVVDHFGPDVVRPDRSINRSVLAGVVFGDPEALAKLNQLTHPVIGQVMAERAQALGSNQQIVVLDVALLSIVTTNRFQLGAVVVVDTPEEVAVARLVQHRGFSEEDAWSRVAAQIDRDERRRLADVVIDNSDGQAALETEIDRAWDWLRQRATQT
jgi:dephospho-CoA kinase